MAGLLNRSQEASSAPAISPPTSTIAPMPTTPPASGQQDIVAQAIQQYPILKSVPFAHVTTPMKGDDRMLEFWNPGDQGDKQYPRPSSIPMDRPGVQIISPKTKPSDVAADVVSHYLVERDPKLKKMYDQFAATFDTPQGQKRLREDYEWEKKNASYPVGPFDQFVKRNRIPAYFRGYVFQQWPADSYGDMYTDQQRKQLQAMSDYVRGRK